MGFWRIEYKNFKIRSTLTHVCSLAMPFSFLIRLVFFHISKLLGNNFGSKRYESYTKNGLGLFYILLQLFFFVIVHRLQEMGKTLEAPDGSIPDE